MSKNAGKSEMQQSTAIMKKNIARLEAIGVPTVEAQKIALETPELVDQVVAEQLGPSALEEVEYDPRLRSAQFDALDQIRGLAATGLGAEDIEALDRIKRSAAGQAQAQKESILQNAASQGTLDSGAALIAQLTAGQQAADRVSQQGIQQASTAANARRDAIGRQASLASQLQLEDLNQKNRIASARDSINQFNAQNRQNVNASNIASRQAIENQRVANLNQQNTYNTGLLQQKYQNEIQKAGGVANQNTALAANLQQQASAAQQAQQALTGSIINAGTAIGSAALKKSGTQAVKAEPTNANAKYANYTDDINDIYEA